MGVLQNNIQLVAPIQNNFTADNQGTPTTRFTARTRYFGRTGKMSIPTAALGDPYGGSPRTPATLVQTSAPYSGVEVTWTSERVGARPKVPDPQLSSGTGFVLVAWEVITESVPLNDDGLTYTYTASGTYLYAPAGDANPVWAKDRLPMGKAPNDVTGPGAFMLEPGDFDPTLNPLNAQAQLGRVS